MVATRRTSSAIQSCRFWSAHSPQALGKTQSDGSLEPRGGGADFAPFESVDFSLCAPPRFKSPDLGISCLPLSVNLPLGVISTSEDEDEDEGVAPLVGGKVTTEVLWLVSPLVLLLVSPLVTNGDMFLASNDLLAGWFGWLKALCPLVPRLTRRY